MISKEIVQKRKSIRKYDMKELENDLLTEIAIMIKQTKPLLKDNKINFKIINKNEFFEKTGGLFRVEAPHYICFFGDGSDDSYKNIGYIGELIVLKLTEMELGTCWLGGAKSKETLSDDKYAISIAFGRPLEGMRTTPKKRKDLNEIAENYNNKQKEILEMVRLAPSAVNFQPWYFKCEQELIHVFRKNSGGLYAKMANLKTMQKIDIGIAIAHFTIVPFTFIKLDIKEKNMIYECSLQL